MARPIRDVAFAVAGIDEPRQRGCLDREARTCLFGSSRWSIDRGPTGRRCRTRKWPPCPLEDISWAVQRLLETIARDQTSIVVFDDIEWAETAFLDVIDAAVTSIRETRLLLICTESPGAARAAADMERALAEPSHYRNRATRSGHG